VAVEELSELLMQRRRKVDAMWEAGVNPYPNDFRQDDTSQDVKNEYDGSEAIDEEARSFTVAGRIIARRSFGKAAALCEEGCSRR
jgi:lysyl-tRNA synthetase class 2